MAKVSSAAAGVKESRNIYEKYIFFVCMKRDDKTSRRNHCVDLQNGADDSPALELGPLLGGVERGAWLLPTAWVY